uniref:Uncharacterized protein n=1 Tax=Glossina brevipalpis TaxID=37001 RepID=A0A1A9W8Y5_9MUSC
MKTTSKTSEMYMARTKKLISFPFVFLSLYYDDDDDNVDDDAAICGDCIDVVYWVSFALGNICVAFGDIRVSYEGLQFFVMQFYVLLFSLHNGVLAVLRNTQLWLYHLNWLRMYREGRNLPIRVLGPNQRRKQTPYVARHTTMPKSSNAFFREMYTLRSHAQALYVRVVFLCITYRFVKK